jgi:transposase
MIATLIFRRWGIRLSKASVGRLLAQLGLTCQRPLHWAIEQNPGLVDRWLKEEFPRIRSLARQVRAEIYFGDEAGIRSDFHGGTTWAPRGKTPVVRTTGARFDLNMISAVSPKGQLRFMVIRGRINAKKVCEFIRRLMYGSQRPIVLILDNHPVHLARQVRRCVESFPGRLYLFYLSPYSPELNLDEFVWNHVKTHGIGRMNINGPRALHSKVIGCLRALQKAPHIIRNYFHSKHTAYAA